MIQRYVFGRMLPTDTVVLPLPAETGALPHFQKDGASLRYALSAREAVYGLGEQVRGINKRGWRYVSFCADDPHHTEDKVSLYAAHNFLVLDGGAETFGVFLDFGGRVEYDVGYTRRSELVITPAEENYDLYLITENTVAEIASELRRLTGRSYIPPKWAFGFGQSRWGYRNEADIRAVARGYRENGLPLDMIYLDIDYMQDYRDFTVNPERFPDLPALSDELKADGIRLVPIIDAGIRAEPSDPVYAEGLAKGYFCEAEDGSPFEAAVWPGLCCFTDVLRPEARAWFGAQYRFLTEQGIEGFWNDMNEPALFYTERRLRKALDRLQELRGETLGIQTSFTLQGIAASLANAPEDYASFYHVVNGERVRHDRVHNLYGYHMTMAAGEALERLRPGKRTLLFARASCIGAHRYGGIWLGDNQSWWSHLALNVRQMPNVNLCGFLFSGADLCGFGSDTTPELALRWLAFGIFTPLMRNHSALGTREQEFYRFPEELDAARRLLGLRYVLLPYLYSEFVKAALGDGLYFRALAFDYPDDPIARETEDQLLLGEGVMIAPVIEPNAAGRVVYLPEPMKLFRLRKFDDYDEELLPAGHHYLPCALGEVLLFLRPGAIVPVCAGGTCVEQLDCRPEHLTLWSYLPEGTGSYLFYDDDGVGTDYDAPEHWTRFTVQADGHVTLQPGKD